MERELKISKSTEINANIAKVWDTLTNPELTKKYFFGCEVISDWKIGNPIIFREFRDGEEIIDVKGKILSIEPCKSLRFTAWGPQSGLEDTEANYSIVTYNLVEQKDITKFTVSQENFDNNEKGYNDSDKGWDYVLTALKEFLERPQKK